MSGLLGGVLPFIYSRSDAMKRQVRGLLADPAATFEQAGGLLIDRRREHEDLHSKAFGDKSQPFKVTDKDAFGRLSDNMMGLLSFAPVGMMAGVGAKTANKAMLAKAEAMEKQGAKPAAIWQETGWGRGPDSKWRFEIEDKIGDRVNPMRDQKPAGWTPKTVGDYTRSKVLDAYPDLKGVRINTEDVYKVDPFGSVKGAYDDAGKTLYMQPSGDVSYPTAIHELQHAVQRREGFSGGGNPYQMSEDQYLRLAGEAEARLTQARINMTPEQRLRQYPWAADYFQEATGVPLDSLLLR